MRRHRNERPLHTNHHARFLLSVLHLCISINFQFVFNHYKPFLDNNTTSVPNREALGRRATLDLREGKASRSVA